jgi:hypothetical protein
VQARKASFFKTLDLPVPIQKWEVIKDKREKIRILSSTEQRELISSALWGDKERLEQRLDYLFASLGSAVPAAQTEEIRCLILEMFGVLFSRLCEIDMEPRSVFMEESELFQVDYSLHSPSHFSVLFKKHTGKTFTDYILAARMEASKELILRGLKVKDISWNVGYEDSSHFVRIGIIACYDNFFPEIPCSLPVKGAEILLSVHAVDGQCLLRYD